MAVVVVDKLWRKKMGEYKREKREER